MTAGASETVAAIDPARLVVYVAGARSGNPMLDLWARFRDDIVAIGFDADPAAIPGATAALARQAGTATALPHALGAVTGPGLFYLNRDPYTSSVYPLNPDFADFTGLFYATDYRLGDVAATRRTLPVTLRRLDDLVGTAVPGLADAALPPPDLLLLDTQGNEVDILDGAAGCLAGPTIAVVSETAFHPVYQGQRTFGDMVRLLEGHGFLFAGFDEMGLYAPNRVPVPWRSGGIPLFCDAIFLRRPDRLPQPTAADDPAGLPLAKLALVAFGLGLTELALAALTRIPLPDGGTADGGAVVHPAASTGYLAFLGTLAALAARLALPLPLPYVQVYRDGQGPANPAAWTQAVRYGDADATPIETMLQDHGFDRAVRRVQWFRRHSSFRIGTPPADQETAPRP